MTGSASSRRTLLRAVLAAAAGTGLAGCAGKPSSDTRSRAELEARIEALEAENERLRQQLRRARTEYEQAAAGHRDGGAQAASPDLPPPAAAVPPDDDIPRSVIRQAQAVGQAARDSVVYVETRLPGSGRSVGTGWVFDQQRIATNAHVIHERDAGTLAVYTLDGTDLSVSVVGETLPGSDLDFALLEPGDPSLTPAPLPHGDPATVEPGQPVLQIGQPLFIGEWIIALGRLVSLRSPTAMASRLPQTGGNSGSPLLTLDGTVIGMTWGSAPAEPTDGPTSPPTPDPPQVYTEYPYQQAILAQQDPITALEAQATEWD